MTHFEQLGSSPERETLRHIRVSLSDDEPIFKLKFEFKLLFDS